MRTPTTEQLIRPTEEGFPGWEAIAQELAGEVTRLRSEIDRLKGGDGKEPLASKADWTHPLYPVWVALGLDDIHVLVAAWHEVRDGRCPKCQGSVESAEYADAVCDPCQLVYYATDGHFAIDTVERAMDRGPDV
jgi:hypothetical protein